MSERSTHLVRHGPACVGGDQCQNWVSYSMGYVVCDMEYIHILFQGICFIEMSCMSRN